MLNQLGIHEDQALKQLDPAVTELLHRLVSEVLSYKDCENTQENDYLDLQEYGRSRRRCHFERPSWQPSTNGLVDDKKTQKKK